MPARQGWAGKERALEDIQLCPQLATLFTFISYNTIRRPGGPRWLEGRNEEKNRIQVIQISSDITLNTPQMSLR